MRERVRKKLQGRAGESIAEALVALLVASLALTMLAGMITTSSHLVERSGKVLYGPDGYYAEEDKLAIQSGTGDGQATVKVTDPLGGGSGTLLSGDAYYYQAGTATQPIYAYHKK